MAKVEHMGEHHENTFVPARLGLARSGQGSFRLGSAQLGLARLGLAQPGSPARPSSAHLGSARSSLAWLVGLFESRCFCFFLSNSIIPLNIHTFHVDKSTKHPQNTPETVLSSTLSYLGQILRHTPIKIHRRHGRSSAPSTVDIVCAHFIICRA